MQIRFFKVILIIILIIKWKLDFITKVRFKIIYILKSTPELKDFCIIIWNNIRLIKC
jgi:hypothetical protein